MSIWTYYKGQSVGLRLILSGTLGAVLLIGVSAINRFAAPIESARLALPTRGPTLEAINKSTIDATGAQIPGDLPFQFGRAENESLIAMPGVNVTQKQDGSISVTPPENVNIQFPAPTGEFVWMPNSEIKNRLLATASNLRDLHERFAKDFSEAAKTFPDRTPMRSVGEKYSAIYAENFAELSSLLTAAALTRIPPISSAEMSFDARHGITIVYYKKFVGPSPASQAAALLEYLAGKLPD